MRVAIEACCQLASADFALATASSISATLENATDFSTSPVAGLKTSPRRSLFEEVARPLIQLAIVSMGSASIAHAILNVMNLALGLALLVAESSANAGDCSPRC